MNKYLYFVYTIFFLLPATLFAQASLGVEGGLSSNSYETNISNRAAATLVSHIGISADLPFRYAIHSWLWLAAAPGFVQKGYSMNRTDSLYGEYDRHINNYLQLPIAVSFVCHWRRLRASLDPGGYAGYWVSGRVEGKTADIFNGTGNTTSESFVLSDYSSRYSFLSQRDNRWEFGWTLGLGLYYHLAGPCWLSAGVKFYQSLTSQEKAAVSPVPAYNRTWTYSIGGSWTLDKL